MIEAVIWDFGGVLTTSPFEAFSRFETERGLPADIIRRTNAANHLENAWAKFERAEVDIEAFDALFAAESLALGAEVRGKDVLLITIDALRADRLAAYGARESAFTRVFHIKVRAPHPPYALAMHKAFLGDGEQRRPVAPRRRSLLIGARSPHNVRCCARLTERSP